MSTRVKICGITRREDGLAALEAGANALGFVLAERSPRRLEGDVAAALLDAIRRAAPRPFLAVAVLDRLDPAAGQQAIDQLGFDRVQFQAMEAMAALHDCLAAFEEADLRAWGGVRVGDPGSLAGAGELSCEAVLLDSKVEGRAGGSGQAFDWALAGPLAARRRVVLAGGLTAGNVAAAIRAVHPWMVDVSSGVEAGPGVKDPARIAAFVEAARGA